MSDPSRQRGDGFQFPGLPQVRFELEGVSDVADKFDRAQDSSRLPVSHRVAVDIQPFGSRTRQPGHHLVLGTPGIHASEGRTSRARPGGIVIAGIALLAFQRHVLPVPFLHHPVDQADVQVPIEHDVIFLGNARENRPDGRAIVGDLIQTGLDFKVWGNLWDSLLPEPGIPG